MNNVDEIPYLDGSLVCKTPLVLLLKRKDGLLVAIA